jgi:hypothetical protein
LTPGKKLEELQQNDNDQPRRPADER